MTLRKRYERARFRLLNDSTICGANRQLFREFFEFEEYKLKRQNGIATLDDACYKTLLGYIGKLRNVNSWFANTPWKELTKTAIKQVYDDLEEGRITNRNGERYRDRSSYYNKIFKSKPFRLAGKAEIARDVMEFATEDTDRAVRYVTEEQFRKLVSVIGNPTHQLLFWLQWDIGENINTLLRLTRQDLRKQNNAHTREPEYIVNLPRAKLKRSRQTRSEPTLYPETVRLLDTVLEGLTAEEDLFQFGHRQALKLIHMFGKKSKARCAPYNDAIRWKDLRSGMACHLLQSGWTRDEVNARLGHTPSSRALDAYINYLAIDRNRPKQRLRQTHLEKIQSQLEESKRQQQLLGDRLARQSEAQDTLKHELAETRQELTEFVAIIQKLARGTTRAGRRRNRKSVDDS